MITKLLVLEILECNRGRSLSGAGIAKRLNITRNSVWKAIKELRKDGYNIAAATNKGYCLCDDNDFISAQGMLPFLADSEIYERIFVYDTLESTNTTAKALALSGAAHGTIIMAESQTGGKGRYSRGFFSPPGHGIYMSFILRPAQWYWNGAPVLMTSYAAVSVCEAIETATGKSPQIKWVNDVFLDGKKICGILTEAVTDLESGSIQWIVVGIGVNFTAPAFGFPDEIKHIAGAVFSDDRPTMTRNRLAAEIANRILNIENAGDSGSMLAEYKKRLMMIGKKVTVANMGGAGEVFEALAIDIDDMGRLVVKKGDGEILSLFSGEIHIEL